MVHRIKFYFYFFIYFFPPRWFVKYKVLSYFFNPKLAKIFPIFDKATGLLWWSRLVAIGCNVFIPYSSTKMIRRNFLKWWFDWGGGVKLQKSWLSNHEMVTFDFALPIWARYLPTVVWATPTLILAPMCLSGWNLYGYLQFFALWWLADIIRFILKI